jgi:hypothetical protein
MMASKLFPHLTPENHQVTSPATPAYNCIAWAAGDTQHWWQPGLYWPVTVPSDDYSVGALMQAFKSQGYEDCALNATLEPGFDKVALYGNALRWTHAARQLPTGKWTSKLGKDVDIEHETPQDIAGGVYEELMHLMKRPIPGAA